MERFDLAVIGAGPAGMTTASQAASLGLRVALLDEQPRAGGQIYRDVDRVKPARAAILGQDYTYGKRLTYQLARESLVHFTGAMVWSIEDGFRVFFTKAGNGAKVVADKVVLATGALERPMPVPGWTLPGVMTAGAGQILLKQSGVLARNAVLVGSGPLLYLTAAQMVRAGSPPVALIETQTRADLISAMRHLGGAMRGWQYLIKGLRLLSEIIRAGVPRYVSATNIAIEGQDTAEAISFATDGKQHRIACSTVFLHHGIVPNTQAARSLGAIHCWDDRQACFTPKLDEWCRTNVRGLYVVGDGGGIAGAKAAEISGRLVALKLAEETGYLPVAERDSRARLLRSALVREHAVRPFLDVAYPPYAAALTPDDDTIVCRCEEVTAGDIRGYAKLGCRGPNQTKAFGRAGMGPCQGRYCGLTVTALLTQAHGQTPDDTGYYRIRPPLKPVTLGELAAMSDPEHDVGAETSF